MKRFRNLLLQFPHLEVNQDKCTCGNQSLKEYHNANLFMQTLNLSILANNCILQKNNLIFTLVPILHLLSQLRLFL